MVSPVETQHARSKSSCRPLATCPARAAEAGDARTPERSVSRAFLPPWNLCYRRGGLLPASINDLHSSYFFSTYGSSIILVLPASNIFTKFRRGQPLEALNTGGTKISRFSTNKSLYLANDTKYRHTYYGRRIGNRTQAFEWHQF